MISASDRRQAVVFIVTGTKVVNGCHKGILEKAVRIRRKR